MNFPILRAIWKVGSGAHCLGFPWIPLRERLYPVILKVVVELYEHVLLMVRGKGEQRTHDSVKQGARSWDWHTGKLCPVTTITDKREDRMDNHHRDDDVDLMPPAGFRICARGFRVRSSTPSVAACEQTGGGP